MFIERVMQACSNYFMNSVEFGEYTINNERVTSSLDLKANSYVLIHGSEFNDGVYTVDSVTDTEVEIQGLIAEEFKGYIVKLVVPREFVSLASKLEEYNTNNPISNLASESIPNYSYTVATGTDGSQGWQSIYRNDLIAYSKFPRTIGEQILLAERLGA